MYRASHFSLSRSLPTDDGRAVVKLLIVGLIIAQAEAEGRQGSTERLNQELEYEKCGEGANGLAKPKWWDKTARAEYDSLASPSWINGHLRDVGSHPCLGCIPDMTDTFKISLEILRPRWIRTLGYIGDQKISLPKIYRSDS